MNTELNNAENILIRIMELENALEQMTETILGDADECPDGYEWYDTALDALDSALCGFKAEMVKRYRVAPVTLLKHRVVA